MTIKPFTAAAQFLQSKELSYLEHPTISTHVKGLEELTAQITEVEATVDQLAHSVFKEIGGQFFSIRQFGIAPDGTRKLLAMNKDQFEAITTNIKDYLEQDGLKIDANDPDAPLMSEALKTNIATSFHFRQSDAPAKDNSMTLEVFNWKQKMISSQDFTANFDSTRTVTPLTVATQSQLQYTHKRKDKDRLYKEGLKSTLFVCKHSEDLVPVTASLFSNQDGKEQKVLVSDKVLKYNMLQAEKAAVLTQVQQSFPPLNKHVLIPYKLEDRTLVYLIFSSDSHPQIDLTILNTGNTDLTTAQNEEIKTLLDTQLTDGGLSDRIKTPTNSQHIELETKRQQFIFLTTLMKNSLEKKPQDLIQKSIQDYTALTTEVGYKESNKIDGLIDEIMTKQELLKSIPEDKLMQEVTTTEIDTEDLPELDEDTQAGNPHIIAITQNTVFTLIHRTLLEHTPFAVLATSADTEEMLTAMSVTDNEDIEEAMNVDTTNKIKKSEFAFDSIFTAHENLSLAQKASRTIEIAKELKNLKLTHHISAGPLSDKDKETLTKGLREKQKNLKAELIEKNKKLYSVYTANYNEDVSEENFEKMLYTQLETAHANSQESILISLNYLIDYKDKDNIDKRIASYNKILKHFGSFNIKFILPEIENSLHHKSNTTKIITSFNAHFGEDSGIKVSS